MTTMTSTVKRKNFVEDIDEAERAHGHQEKPHGPIPGPARSLHDSRPRLDLFAMVKSSITCARCKLSMIVGS